jgi:hypothetical protein
VACCATIAGVMRSIIADLTPALVRQDHAISPYASASHVSRHHASTAACPNVSDVANAPLAGQDGRNTPVICSEKTRKYF